MLHFKGTPPLETERLLLRRINDGDLNDIYQYASNEKVTQYVLWETHESLEDTKDFYRTYVQANLENDHGADWAIIRKEDGTFLGSIGLMNPDFDTNTVEVGYVLGENHWGKGYMSEALDRIVGLPDAAVKEAKERVSSAIKNSGFKPPHYFGRITVNLAPADLKKEGPFSFCLSAFGLS